LAAFGSGFKANTMVLKARDISKPTWFDEFDKEYTFDPEVLKVDLVDKEEMEFNYEEWDK
jgi:hypothetical protein